MAIHPTILDRLVSARSLLEHSGPRLNPQSDSRAVAFAVVLSQDAAELALKAVADQLNIQLAKDNFPTLVDEVQATLGLSGPGANHLKRLNDARVSFKHKGNLPDAGTWFNAAELTTDYLNEICIQVFKIPLTEIDLVHLIQDSHIVKLLQGAKNERENNRFREALEEIALALVDANLSIFPSGLAVMPGNPDPQLALLLAGYGVESASFITMQQLLPRADMFGKIVWSGNEFGHSGNWNDENVLFCLDTIINLMVRLQGAQLRPQPKKFYDIFRHVLTIKVEQPNVKWAQEVYFPSSHASTVIMGDSLDGFNIGDRIYGRLSACNELGNWPRPDRGIDEAEWLKVTSPSWEGCETITSDKVLVVRREHVDISVEEIID